MTRPGGLKISSSDGLCLGHLEFSSVSCGLWCGIKDGLRENIRNFQSLELHRSENSRLCNFSFAFIRVIRGKKFQPLENSGAETSSHWKFGKRGVRA